MPWRWLQSPLSQGMSQKAYAVPTYPQHHPQLFTHCMRTSARILGYPVTGSKPPQRAVQCLIGCKPLQVITSSSLHYPRPLLPSSSICARHKFSNLSTRFSSTNLQSPQNLHHKACIPSHRHQQDPAAVVGDDGRLIHQARYLPFPRIVRTFRIRQPHLLC